MAEDQLVGRIRTALQGRNVREVNMFGGVSFIVDDRMLVAARKDGDLLVRIDPADNDMAMALPGVHEAMMGKDRPMGPSWVSVERDHLATDADLDRWLHLAFAFHERQAE